MNQQKKQIIGDLVLLFVALGWGISFPLIENAVRVINPTVFMAIRFTLATAFLLPFVWNSFFKNTQETKKIMQASAILGLLNTASYVCEAIGMQTVTSAQGAFIAGVSVVIVPFLAPLFRLSKPSTIDFLCSLLCLLGLFLLTEADFLGIGTGGLWVLACAFFYALFIVYLQKLAPQITNLNKLSFFQILFTGIFCAMLSVGHSYAPITQKDVLIGILFCAIFATSLAIPLQTKYQHYTTASRAAAIFCLEPVFGSLFGYIINREKLSAMSLLGGLVIIVGIALSQVQDKFVKK